MRYDELEARDRLALLQAVRALYAVLDGRPGASLEHVTAAVREVSKSRQLAALVHLSAVCERHARQMGAGWDVNRYLAELMRIRLPKPDRHELIERIDALEGNLRGTGAGRRCTRPAARRPRTTAPRPAA